MQIQRCLEKIYGKKVRRAVATVLWNGPRYVSSVMKETGGVWTNIQKSSARALVYPHMQCTSEKRFRLSEEKKLVETLDVWAIRLKLFKEWTSLKKKLQAN